MRSQGGRLVCSWQLASALRPLAHSHDGVWAAVDMVTSLAGHASRLAGPPLASVRRPAAAARRGTFGLCRPREGHVALGPAGEASFPTGRTVVAAR